MTADRRCLARDSWGVRCHRYVGHEGKHYGPFPESFTDDQGYNARNNP